MKPLNKPARVRIAELLTIAEPHFPHTAGLISNAELFYGGPPAPLIEGAAQILRQAAGVDIQSGQGWWSTTEVCEKAEEALLMAFLAASQAHLMRVAGSTGGKATPLSPDAFEKHLNGILESTQHDKRLRGGKIVDSIADEAAALRRALLAGADEAAGCTQGDVQVEMVVSTIQSALAVPGAVLVDYGVGLGRVLAGLSTAALFPNATYVGVDEPISKETKLLAKRIGRAARFESRTAFLSGNDRAHVIMVVNTLHHIPFVDLSRQLAVLLGRLLPGGVLLVHDMGVLHEPEQRNVPWPIEDIIALFSTPLLRTNPRSTTSRSKRIPLANVLVQVSQPGDLVGELQKNVIQVWRTKKERVLQEIDTLYASRDTNREVELQHALIINANLDLNPV